MMLRCNICLKRSHNNASVRTDILWLKTIDGRDYLVCKFHRGADNDERERNTETNVPVVQETV